MNNKLTVHVDSPFDGHLAILQHTGNHQSVEIPISMTLITFSEVGLH